MRRRLLYSHGSVATKIIKYGRLYNWYAATDVRNICSSGWHVPTQTEFQTLSDYLGGNLVSGGKLKEIGTSNWTTPNTGATNEVGFNGRGSGQKYLGAFSQVNITMHLLTTSVLAYNILRSYDNALLNSVSNFSIGGSSVLNSENHASSVRILKDTTTLTHGQTGTYTGNDGRVYPTICIGTQEWISCNLAETKYRNGDLIPKVTDNTAWATLTTGALCAYNNDETNVYEN